MTADLPTDEARRALADKLEEELERVRQTFGTLDYCTHMTFILPPDDVLLALASLRAKTAGGAGEWKPADTAPTNVAVQVYCPGLDYYGNQGVYAGMLVGMGTGQRWMTFAWAMGRDMCGENRPTHWRPLPAAPESPDEAARRTLDQNRGGEDG